MGDSGLAAIAVYVARVSTSLIKMRKTNTLMDSMLKMQTRATKVRSTVYRAAKVVKNV